MDFAIYGDPNTIVTITHCFDALGKSRVLSLTFSIPKVLLYGACSEIFNSIISNVTVNVIHDESSRISASAHEINYSVGSIKLALEFHSVIAVTSHANHRTNLAVTATGRLDSRQA
jgi:hypothetical protein